MHSSNYKPALWLLSTLLLATSAAASSAEPPEQAKVRMLTIERLRDGSLVLQQLKQECIYLYMEATRTECDASAAREVVLPSSISEQTLSTAARYLPARPEWVMYYIGTMEPIIHLFENNVEDTRTGARQLLVAEAEKKDAHTLFEEWAAAVDSLNAHLAKLTELATDKNGIDNRQVAKEAIAMYELTQHMEKTRQKAWLMVKEHVADKESTVKMKL